MITSVVHGKPSPDREPRFEPGPQQGADDTADGDRADHPRIAMRAGPRGALGGDRFGRRRGRRAGAHARPPAGRRRALGGGVRCGVIWRHHMTPHPRGLGARAATRRRALVYHRACVCTWGRAMTTVRIIAALLLVLLNGFFVAAEFALARARLTRLDQMSQDGLHTAGLAAHQVRHIDRYLAACQLGVTLASLGLGWLGAPAFEAIVRPPLEHIGLGSASTAVIAAVIAFTIITVLHVVIGELAPKNLAIQRAEATARTAARPLEAFRIVLGPLIHVLNSAANGVVRLVGIEPATPHELASTPEDLQRLIAEGEVGGTIEPAEADMLEGVFSLGERIARDVMTPRPEVKDLSADMPIREALHEALASRHSRFPVVGGDGVGVIGVVHLSELARGLLELADSAEVRAVTGPGAVRARDPAAGRPAA